MPAVWLLLERPPRIRGLGRQQTPLKCLAPMHAQVTQRFTYRINKDQPYSHSYTTGQECHQTSKTWQRHANPARAQRNAQQKWRKAKQPWENGPNATHSNRPSLIGKGGSSHPGRRKLRIRREQEAHQQNNSQDDKTAKQRVQSTGLAANNKIRQRPATPLWFQHILRKTQNQTVRLIIHTHWELN